MWSAPLWAWLNNVTLPPLLIYQVVYLHNNRWGTRMCMSASMSLITASIYVFYGRRVNEGNCWEKQHFPAALLWLVLRRDIKRRQTNTVENSETVAVKEKFGGPGRKTTSSKHLWRTNAYCQGQPSVFTKSFCVLFLSPSLVHSLWFTAQSLHMLPLCSITYKRGS